MLRRTLSLALAIGALVTLASFHADATPIVSVPNLTVGVGDSIPVSISITDAIDLEYFQFDLAFDPLIVAANNAGATTGALLPADWYFTSSGFVDDTAGHILGVSAFGSAFSGSGEIAVINFTALAPGVSGLMLSNVFLNLSDHGFNTSNGQLSVPEPGTLSLLVCGFVLISMARRLRRRRQSAW